MSIIMSLKINAISLGLFRNTDYLEFNLLGKLNISVSQTGNMSPVVRGV